MSKKSMKRAREVTNEGMPASHLLIERTATSRFFIEKLRSLGVTAISDRLDGYVIEACYGLVFSNFPSYQWDVIIDRLVSEEDIRDAITSHLMADVDRAVAAKTLQDMLRIDFVHPISGRSA